MSKDDLTVLVTLRARPGDAPRLLAALQADRHESLIKEPGCKAFTILVDAKNPCAFILHEVYQDRDAFEAHRGQPHFQAFEAAVERFAEGDPHITLCNSAD